MTETGKVGVSLTNPSFPLDVSGWVHTNRGIDLGGSNFDPAVAGRDYLSSQGAQLGANLLAGNDELDFITPAYDPGPSAFAFLKKSGTAPPYTLAPLAVIQRNGKVGIGTTDPQSMLEIKDTNLGGGLLINGPASDSANVRFRDPSQNPQDFNIDYTGGSLRFFTETSPSAAGTLRMSLSNTGNASIQGSLALGGSLTQGSSQALKKDITFLDEDALDTALKYVLDTPVATFRYKASAEGSRLSWGIIAERTPAALLGDDNKSINLSNTVGILMASIKAQQKKIEAQEAHIALLEAQQAEIEAQRAQIAELEAQMAKLLAR